MLKYFTCLFILISTKSLAVTGSLYPSYVLKNQYGETSINSVVGGSGALDCVFTVNTNDPKGITGLVGPLCASVFMHTEVTPAAGNPNPDGTSGIAVVNLKSAYYALSSATATFTNSIPDPTPTSVSSPLAPGLPYVITSVGTTTAAQWQHIGLPSGIIPAVGTSFIEAGFSTTSGTGMVNAPGTAAGGVNLFDIVGSPAGSNGGGAATGGGQILVRFLSSVNPNGGATDGTIVGLHFVLLPLSSQLH